MNQTVLLNAFSETAATTELERSKFSSEERMKKYGKMIGIIERIIIISAILISQFQIVLLLITIKSIVRFKEITNKTSDYYIIGNFSDFSISFLIGYALNAVRNFLLG